MSLVLSVPDGSGGFSQSTELVGVRGIRTRLTNAQIKLLPTTPVVLVPDPTAGGLLYLGGRFMSHIEVAYTGLKVNYSYMAIQRAVSGYDVSVYAVKDSLSGETALQTLLGIGGAEISVPPAQYPITITGPFNVLQGGWENGESGGFDFNRGLQVAINNGASGNLGGGHANNWLDVFVCYAVFDDV